MYALDFSLISVNKFFLMAPIVHFSSTFADMFSVRPIRIIFHCPLFISIKPSIILSTAVWDWDTIRILDVSSSLSICIKICCIISFITVVFPVPGGPCIKLILSE